MRDVPIATATLSGYRDINKSA